MSNMHELTESVKEKALLLVKAGSQACLKDSCLLLGNSPDLSLKLVEGKLTVSTPSSDSPISKFLSEVYRDSEFFLRGVDKYNLTDELFHRHREAHLELLSRIISILDLSTPILLEHFKEKSLLFNPLLELAPKPKQKRGKKSSVTVSK